jgi:hypothetical protein
LRVELVEGLARMIEHGKAEVPFAIDQIAQIRATLAGVANIADFLDDLDAAERMLPLPVYEHRNSRCSLLVFSIGADGK